MGVYSVQQGDKTEKKVHCLSSVTWLPWQWPAAWGLPTNHKAGSCASALWRGHSPWSGHRARQRVTYKSKAFKTIRGDTVGWEHSPVSVAQHGHDIIQHFCVCDVIVGQHRLIHLAGRRLPDLQMSERNSWFCCFTEQYEKTHKASKLHLDDHKKDNWFYLAIQI